MLFGSSITPEQPAFAYFSMEIGLDASIPTYSGGLGVLAGDTLRAAADIGVPMVGVTLLHRNGYFLQHLDTQGNQQEGSYDWHPEEHMTPVLPRITVEIEGREVWVRAWRYIIVGVSGHTVPVYFLDTALLENSLQDRRITDSLYGGDTRYRLMQEAVLGLGGVWMLKALSYDQIHTYHMNEGHSSLLTLALLEQQCGPRLANAVTRTDREAVRRKCVFTTHTPVPAGHDKFPREMVQQVLGESLTGVLEASDCLADNTLNMTDLALRFARYINGVSLRHEEVSRSMFPNYPINSITNGVHAVTWASVPFRSLFDCYIPEWRNDNAYLRYAMSIPLQDVQGAHTKAKADLVAQVKEKAGVTLDAAALTIGFARRATGYKRADLLFSDLERLRQMAKEVGPIQVVYGGKAHPRDASGKELIRRIFQAALALGDDVRVVYLEEYNMALAKYICSGVDLWLNNPQKPHEASGTSGMKSAINGVPSLSVLDGWWVEGHVEGATGWSIDDGADVANANETASLYDKLENIILPMFYRQPQEYARVQRSSIALNGSFFNAQRMMFQYVEHAYQPFG